MNSSKQGLPFVQDFPRLWFRQTSSQRKHDYVISKMKLEEIEKQNEVAICVAKQKKQMEIDELEENNRKRLAEATLQEFELLDAVSKGSQSETTAIARSSMRSEKALQDLINTSHALSFNNEEKTREVTKATRPLLYSI